MKTTYPELSGWRFDGDEVSAGVYEVIGSDEEGHRVSAQGTDFDAVLEECRKTAINLQMQGYAASLARLAYRFRRQENRSFSEMLRDVKFPLSHDGFDAKYLQLEFAAYPEFADEWLAYSEDKRTTAGWFLTRNDDAGFVVGRIDVGGKIHEQHSYRELHMACADFVLREVNSLG